MLMNFDQLILPPGITTLSRGGKRRRHTRKFSRRHKKSNKSRTRRRHY